MIGGETLAPSQPILQVVTQHEVEFFVVEAIRLLLFDVWLFA